MRHCWRRRMTFACAVGRVIAGGGSGLPTSTSAWRTRLRILSADPIPRRLAAATVDGAAPARQGDHHGEPARRVRGGWR
jgi:hypothetical protein